MDLPVAVVFDLGGTSLNIGIVAGPVIIAQESLPTGPDILPERLMGQAMTRLHELLQTAEISLQDQFTFALGVPTVIKNDEMESPPVNLHPSWGQFSLRKFIKAYFPLCLLKIANDTALATMGEHEYGAGRNAGTMVYLTISTGIGGEVYLEGQGLLELPLEFGHMAGGRRGIRCGCGSLQGCIEAQASGGAIAKAAQQAIQRAIKAGKESDLLAFAQGKGFEIVDAEVVCRAAAGKSPTAERILKAARQALSILFINAANLFGPNVIVVGGGLTGSWDLSP